MDYITYEGLRLTAKSLFTAQFSFIHDYITYEGLRQIALLFSHSKTGNWDYITYEGLRQ